MPVLLRMVCAICGRYGSRKLVKRHLRGKCPVLKRLAESAKTSPLREVYSPSPPRSRCEARRRRTPPTTPPPDIPRYRPRRRAESPAETEPEINRAAPDPPDNPYGTVPLRHPDLAFDTPGAGPSGHRTPLYIPRLSQPQPPHPRIYEDEDTDIDDPFADELPWVNGLSPRERLDQELEAEIAQKGGRKLDDAEYLAVRGFNYRVTFDLSARAYGKLPEAFPEIKNLPSEHATKSRMATLSGIRGSAIDCCIDSCVAFTGDYEALNRCPKCNENRFNADGAARKQFRYIPLIPRLVNMFRDPKLVRKLLYRATRRPCDNIISDIFDGSHYSELCRRQVSVAGQSLPHRFFSRPTDIALGLSTDGFGPFKSRKKTCWPLLAFNYNLPPQIRFRLENMLCLGVIPGPKQPKDIGSFLEPFIGEMESLAHGVPAYDTLYRRSFRLHAYLLACFGDMPAVEKLMCILGHNGKSPCRACRIRGVKNPHPGQSKNQTHYTPLSRPFAVGRFEPREYDPLNLPLRTHDEFIMHTNQVESAPTKSMRKKRVQLFGIKGRTPLARLSSLNFPASFPHDFMHAVFQNVVPNLISLWTHSKKAKKFGSGKEDYVLDSKVWSAIGAACSKSGNTIPSLFGCRVPNMSEERYLSTAESTTLFATLLAPALLRGKFRNDVYYTHFIELVRLMNVCMDLEIRRRDIDMLREGFARWVQEFERYRPIRLRACTLPLHCLLHIADDILAMGPVWCYWAFPMERFCGGLAHCQKSRRFPFSSLDRRVLEVSQLSQIKAMYQLGDQLTLDDRRRNVANGTRYEKYPASVFVEPRIQQTLPHSLHRTLADYLSPIVGVGTKTIRDRLSTHQFVQWGRMQSVTDKGPGDLFRANEISPTTETSPRDASYAKYFTNVDRCDVRKPKKLNCVTAGYGQIQRFVVIDTDFLQSLGSDMQAPIFDPIIVSIISPIPLFSLLKDSNLIQYRLPNNQLAKPEVISVDEIVCLVGRVQAPDDTWYIADRNTIVGRLDLVEALVDPG